MICHKLLSVILTTRFQLHRLCEPRYSTMATNILETNKVEAQEEASNKEGSSEYDQGTKRPASPAAIGDEDSSKKQKVPEELSRKELGLPYKKKKMAMIMMYSGKGYYGMQVQRESQQMSFRTIESDLLEALVKSRLVTQQHIEEPGKNMKFQRAARTDKGVSAAGQCCSLMMFTDHPDTENPVEKINNHLPPQIRILGVKRVTKNFDSKTACDSRTYSYLLPTFALCPVEENVVESFRIKEETLKRANEVLSLYRGTHNFHNYTSGKKPSDPSAKRFIRNMTIGDALMLDGMEYAVIKVHGQSFMLHQIRKMIGMMIAIVRGLASVSSIEKSWTPHKLDVPKAPGLGLMLEQCHYDTYSERYAKTHERLSCEEYKEQTEAFKRDYIYKTMTETEKNEKSMLEWLATLHFHHFDFATTDLPFEAETQLGRAAFRVQKLREAQENPVPSDTCSHTDDGKNKDEVQHSNNDGSQLSTKSESVDCDSVLKETSDQGSSSSLNNLTEKGTC